MVLYELIHKLRRDESAQQAQNALKNLVSTPVSIGSEAIELWRAAFGLRPFRRSRYADSYRRLLMQQAAARPWPDVEAIWNDLFRRGHLAFAPDAVVAWKNDFAETFTKQMDDLARSHRLEAKEATKEVVAKRVAEGDDEPERAVKHAMTGFFHDLLLESAWPAIRLVMYLRDALDLPRFEQFDHEWSDDLMGSDLLSAMLKHHGYSGGLEFMMRHYTFLVDRWIFGHSGHRNDFVDLLITSSVSEPSDVFVTEEKWWRRYVGRSEVLNVGLAVPSGSKKPSS